jgi:Na+-transporting NADH:ubiquinone oxidoreductase subunit A
MKGQDVLLLAEGLKTGRYPTSRIIAVSASGNGNGSGCQPAGVWTPAWGPPCITAAQPGNRFRPQVDHGRNLPGAIPLLRTGTWGFTKHRSPLSKKRQIRNFSAFCGPDFSNRPHHAAFLYALHKKHFTAKADMRGEERACINCGKCEQVCPVDIMVQFTYKCIYAGEIEEALMHGLLDCVECGLCSYVCPAKIELAETLKTTRQDYYQDRI